MKKLIYLLVLTFGSTLTAQVQTPQSSPSAKTHQKVGLTELSVEYSRPSMRGRVIMGELVPYGAIWRTGANKNTVISFSDAVTFGDQEISAGSYALYTRPGKDQWEVFFYSSTDNWGTPDLWEASKVAAAIEVIPTIGNDIETFSIWFSNVHNNITATQNPIDLENYVLNSYGESLLHGMYQDGFDTVKSSHVRKGVYDTPIKTKFRLTPSGNLSLGTADVGDTVTVSGRSFQKISDNPIVWRRV